MLEHGLNFLLEDDPAHHYTSSFAVAFIDKPHVTAEGFQVARIGSSNTRMIATTRRVLVRVVRTLLLVSRLSSGASLSVS